MPNLNLDVIAHRPCPRFRTLLGSPCSCRPALSLRRRLMLEVTPKLGHSSDSDPPRLVHNTSTLENGQSPAPSPGLGRRCSCPAAPLLGVTLQDDVRMPWELIARIAEVRSGRSGDVSHRLWSGVVWVMATIGSLICSKCCWSCRSLCCSPWHPQAFCQCHVHVRRPSKAISHIRHRI